MSTAAQFIKAGNLDAARGLLLEAVRKRPTDVNARFELAELLIVQQAWERVDGHLDLLSTQDPTWGALTALLRQLVRAELTRREVFEHGAAPDAVIEPGPEVETTLRILMEHRQGGPAASLRAEADAAAPTLSGVRDGVRFHGIRDLDDRTADVLEVLTSNGKYAWIPWSQVNAVSLRPIERLRDLVWRGAELEVAEGPSGVVYIPAVYLAQSGEQSDAQRLGRETDWIEADGLVRGLGQRCLMLGEEVTPLSEIVELSFDRSATP